jgi:hypothetical protein
MSSMNTGRVYMNSSPSTSSIMRKSSSVYIEGEIEGGRGREREGGVEGDRGKGKERLR